MPDGDGKLSAREYDLFQMWVGENKPLWGIGQTPANNERIRQNSLYRQFLTERPHADITQRTAGIYERGGQPLPAKTTVAPTTAGENIEATRALLSLGQPPPTTTPAPTTPETPSWIGAYEPPPFPDRPAKEGYDWRWSDSAMRYVETARARPTEEEKMPGGMWKTYEEALKGAPEGYLPKQTAEGWWGLQMAPSAAPTADMPQGFYKTYKDAAAAAPAGYTPVQQGGGWWGLQSPETISPYQEQQATQWQQQQKTQQQQFSQQMGWQREQAQMQQAESERMEKARLSAQPISWLEYASYTGEQPAIQPWMQPLMAGQYQTGQEIPGWTPQGGTEMPQLTTPSAQLWSRMGPTAQQQYAGYKQSRTGIRPEETLFRLEAGAPPGGSSPGLRWTK